MGRQLNIGFNQGPATLNAQTIKYGILRPPTVAFSSGGGGAITQRYRSGWYTATLPSQTNGWGDSTPTNIGLGADSGSVSNPWPGAGVINYVNGSIPGGHLGTRNGKNPVTDGPTIMPSGVIGGGQLVQAIVQRYGWYELEPTKNNYVFTRFEADLAQCIALGVWLFPMVVTRTFSNNQVPYPTYLSGFVDPTPGGGYTMRRWDLTNINPRLIALFNQFAQYDSVGNFGGIATQETANSGATNYTIQNYLTALQNEADAIHAATPHARHMAYQNFMSGSGTITSNAATDRYVDMYAAYIQQYGAILSGPDLVVSGGVTTRCYPRMHAYHAGGTVTQPGQTPTVFAGTGPTALSLQNDEFAYTGHGAVQAPTAIGTAFAYGTGGSGSVTKIDIVPIDYHLTNGNPNNQNFVNTGVALITDNQPPFGTWTPP